MNVLIFGSNGMLGKSLTNVLGESHSVYASVRNNKDINFSDNINILNIDLTNIYERDLPKNIDIVIYLAQSMCFREFPSGSIDMLEINVKAPLFLANWAIQSGVKKFIYTSSGGVYRNSNSLSHCVDEAMTINANESNGFYLDSKLSAELLLGNFESLFDTFVVVRPFFMYGTQQDRGMLIPRLINNVMQGNVINLSSEDGIKINPIYIEDATKAFEKMINIEGRHTFNVAGPDVISLRELCEMIGKKVNMAPILQNCNTSGQDLVGDISSMRDKLITPKVSISEGLDEMIKAMY